MKNHFCYYRIITVNKPKANLIIVHGMGESSDDYLHLVIFFNKLDYNVLLYDVKGHGKSSGARGDITNFNIWIDELKNIVDLIKSKNSLKIFLIGHSMG
ncbi:alpha/beta hydrolase, partial [Candidatus Phytoplasma phoenicium]|uniref:alpha/beta hydrolase n=1 Tax=Candidatus Phytoplasma phoenicium TaxID=198422 RepID=UPI001EFA823E